MRYLFSIAWLCLLTFTAYSQTSYEVSAIPQGLMPYASAVVRNMEVATEVKDIANTIYHYKAVVTILNKNGDDNADIVVWYDKSRRIKYIKGVVYDEYGKPVSKFTEKNFSDYSAADGVSMFVDTRLKHFQPAVVNYPYTIEYEYEILSKQTLNFADWVPVPTTGTAVEHSTYQFICKPDFNIRYKQLNYPGEVKTGTSASGQKTYTWQISNLKALRSEPYSPEPEQYQTVVKFAPEKFSYEGYEGSFNNWNQLGKWIYDNLLTGRSTVFLQTVAYLHSLTDTIADPKLKAKAIYEFMQRKNRYVSIQIGIGGYRPFAASEVDQLSYGDCKALVNYTQALLKAVNIESYYCVVQAGSVKKSLLPDFASMDQGNHIILCLPFKNDTTWLECTSKDTPFGYLGDFTDDRWVLACTPDGGKLLHTPKYTTGMSKQVRTAKVVLKEDGELSGQMATTFEGWQYENRPLVPGDISHEIKKAKERYQINNLEIEKLVLNPVKKQQPVNNEEMIFRARDYALLSAGRYFFLANLANRNTYVPRDVRNRTTDVCINRGYTDIDEVTYEVPAGYRMDSNPLNITISKPFGRFTATVVMAGSNQIVYKRKLELIDGTYQKEVYPELVDFYQHVADADNYKIAMIKAN